MVSPREIDQAGLAPAAQTWPNQHLTYTHGYGAVAAQVNDGDVAGAAGVPASGPAAGHD